MSHGRIDMRWHAAPQHGERAHVFRHQFRDDCLRRRTAVRRLAGEHLVGHRAKRVDVGAGVHGAIAGGLLGAHVLRCAEGETGLRHTLTASVADRERDTEVGDERLPVGQQNVLRLEVTMDHAAPMRIVQRLRDRHREAYGLLEGQLPLTLKSRT